MMLVVCSPSWAILLRYQRVYTVTSRHKSDLILDVARMQSLPSWAVLSNYHESALPQFGTHPDMILDVATTKPCGLLKSCVSLVVLFSCIFRQWPAQLFVESRTVNTYCQHIHLYSHI